MIESELERSLAEVALFEGLPPQDLAVLSDLLHRKTVPSGTLLISAEQPGEVVYVILAGTVKIFLTSEDGAEVILAILGPGQTVGEMSLIDSVGRSANVITREPSTLFWISGEAFQRCLRTMPALTYNLTHLLCDRLRLANETIQALASLDVAGRVARQILAFGDQYGRLDDTGRIEIPLRLTQSDIAAIAGTSRERVNRVMTRFRRRGYISIDQAHHIAIHDHEALAARCL